MVTLEKRGSLCRMLLLIVYAYVQVPRTQKTAPEPWKAAWMAKFDRQADH